MLTAAKVPDWSSPVLISSTVPCDFGPKVKLAKHRAHQRRAWHVQETADYVMTSVVRELCVS